jgi:hypothetical protein
VYADRHPLANTDAHADSDADSDIVTSTGVFGDRQPDRATNPNAPTKRRD